MKRFTSLLLALVFCALAACAAPGQSPASPETPVSAEEIPVSAVVNKETGTVLSLGMSRKAVETLLGKGTVLDAQTYWDETLGPTAELGGSSVDADRVDVAYGSGETFLVVFYQEDLVTALVSNVAYSGQASGPSQWVVSQGLTYGGSLAEVLERYGETDSPALTGPGEGPFLLTYQFDAAGQLLRGASQADPAVGNVVFLLEEDTVTAWMVATLPG